MRAISRKAVFPGVALIAALGLASCTESTDTTTDDTSTTSAFVTMTVTPDPATAVASEDDEFEWQGAFTVTFVESGGVGVTINTLSVTVQQSSGGIVLPVSDPDNPVKFDYEADNETNYIAANGTFTMGVKVFYTLPNGRKEALVTVQTSLADDNGYTGSFNDAATVK
jgi:hypothetical protein